MASQGYIVVRGLLGHNMTTLDQYEYEPYFVWLLSNIAILILIRFQGTISYHPENIFNDTLKIGRVINFFVGRNFFKNFPVIRLAIAQSIL